MVYFIGAGPGDPDLITVKGKKRLEEADIIIYAGSLVNPELLKYAKESCEVFNSANMTLEEVISIMERGCRDGKSIVRLHTGDPAIYGAIREQMDELDRLGIKYEVIPGVSSFFAAAAALKKELTLPGVSQTVILTRIEGRTGVPEKESIQSLAQHNATMVIFLSIHMIDDLVEKLRYGYTDSTPVAVVYKASWPDQIILRGTLDNIVETVKEKGIRKTALILVGEFLGNDYELSRLYDKAFSHGFRSVKE
ncbi:MAG: precorrin-4 C(11)-methyltransferase [Acetivibrionales bacterium]|jgi:precorrin-4/cobalt-precorrin-4 C11-methyltransferase